MQQKNILFRNQNSVLIKNNIILGDKLRFTYMCYEDLICSKLLEKFVIMIKNKTLEKATIMVKRENLYEIMDALLDSNRIINASKYVAEQMENFSTEKKKLRIFIKEKVSFYLIEIEKCEDEARILQKQYEVQLNTNRSLWEAHEKAHKVVKRIEDNKNKDKERFCKNCFKWYRDKDNFAWSCKRHVGEWNQANYWCCGNVIRNSPGCVISYHISDDPTQVKAVEINSNSCLTCGSKGHLFNKCPKDPNILQSFKTPNEELERVYKVRNKGRLNSQKMIQPYVVKKIEFSKI